MASLPSHDVTLDKLDGYNYSLWSFKIEMLLQKEDLWEVVTENIPDEPKVEWKKKDSKARAIINLSIADSQIVHVKNLLTAKATWDTLKNIYERKTLSGKIYLLRKLYSLKLEEDKDMQQHITTMMELVDKLRTIGETLKDSHITAILLCSLPKSYSNLITMLESRPDDELTLEFTKNKLLDEHTRRVESSKDESTASKALKSLHGASSQRREKEKKFCSFCHKPNHSKEECWHYQKRNNSNKEYKYENFRRGNVPKYTNQSSVTQEQPTNQRTTKGPNPKALNCTQREASVHNWFVDSGATSHMAYDESFFTELNREQTQNVVVANGNKLQVRGIGQGEIKVITPQGKTDTLLLTKVLYIPELTDNLLSVSAATSNGCKVTFKKDWCTIERDNTALANGILDNGMYRLHLDDNLQTRTFKANVAKQNHCKNKNCLMLWHDRLGHRNIESIKKIQNENLARGLSLNNCSHNTDCVQCIQGKLTETPFPKKTEYRATETLQLVHSDVCGPLPTNSLSGKRYFITFTDDYSRYTKIYLLKGKDEVYEKIKDYVISAHTEFGKNIQTILMVETRSGKMQDPAQERIKAEESAKPQPGATIGRDASSDPVVLNPNIDIPKYDGTEDPRPWIESLEEIGFLYHWADYIISRYAAMNMIGSAKTWLNLHKVSFTSWENFKSRLIEDFASDANKEEMRMRLNRIQQWNEPAIRFAEDILVLCNKVDPQMEEETKINWVIGGLKKEYSFALHLNPPKNTNELLEICKKLDLFEKNYQERAEKSKALYNGPRSPRPHHQEQWKNATSFRRPYQNTSKPQAPAPRYYQNTSKPQAPTPRYYQNKPLPQVSAPRRSYTPNPEPKPVYPSKTYNKNPNSNRNRTEDGRPICFKCNKPGHVARYCRVRIGICEALIDTGADLSVVDLNTALNTGLEIINPDKMCSGPDGKELDIVGNIILNIKFDDKTITHQFVIMRTHLRIVILGRDFLKKMNAKIDCQREIIKYDLTENRDVIKYQQKKIKSAKDAIILELSIKLINAFVEAEDGEYIIEENHKMFQTNGLRLARSLINVVNKETYIWITNPYPRPLKILKNQTLCFGSQPAEVNLMEESEQKEHEEPQFQINENLAYTEKEQLKQVLERYEDLFSSGLGRSNLAKHRIDTEGAKPIKHKPYRVSAKEREIIKEQIDEMLRDGIIRPSSSPWSFPVILVKKRDGKYRFCVDYRKLNDVTVKDVYPIPRIDEVLDTLQGSKYFSAIDLKSGYWQVEVEEKDKEKTAFTTAHGLYEFNVMPFGLCNAPATFERNMENMLGFSKIADPLTSLIKKNVPFTWTENQEKAFQTLKVALINPPILGHFDPNAITYIHTDASNIGLGATLVQKFGDKEKVISYLSRTLSKPEQNYSTTEKECLAVVWSMSKLRPYLYGRHFKIVTDHHALCWLKNLKDPTGRLARWALKIQEYNFEIIHKSGKKHLDADGLSRGPLPENEWDEDYERLFLNQIIDEKDDFIENIKENLSGNKRSITQNFKEENGCLYKKNPNPEGRAWLLVVPKKRRKKVMSEYHNHMLNGHLGVARTTYRLKNKYYWPSMLKDVSEFVKTMVETRSGKMQDPAQERIKAEESAKPQPGATIRTDNGSEYVNRHVEDFLNQSGIKHQLTVPYSPAQNGVAERKNRSLMEMTRCMLFDSGLPQSLWAEAVTTANYLHNRIPSKATDKTPFELWTNRKPSLKHLKRFGCKAFAYIPKIKRNKLDSKVIEGIFLGYDDRSKGYRILHDTDNITISRSVKFLEKENGFHHASTKTTSPQVLSTDLTSSNHIGNAEESQEPGTQSENLEDSETEDYIQPSTSTGTQVVTQRRSTRPTKGIPPIRNDYMLYKTEAQDIQAPIVKHSTIRAFLAASVYKGMQVNHLDVKTAFLHGDLDKELYMELPEGLHTKQTNEVCKLKKAIYGLKQAGRSWNTKIASTLIKNNFKQSTVDPCLFTKNEENHSIYLILYVDDMLLASDSKIIIQNTVKTLEKEFEIKNLGDPTQFIGIEIFKEQRRWFDNNEESLNSWRSFEDAFRGVFGLQEDSARRAEEVLKSRVQKAEESSESYIQEILSLCHQVNPRMEEGEIVAHIIKGISEDTYQVLVAKDIQTVDEILKFCRHLTTVKQRRIGRTKFARLSNVMPISCVDDSDDLAGLIRRIVREEIQKVFSAPEVINPLREVNALEQTVREEVSRALQPTRPQVNVVQQQPRTPYYNIDRPTQPRKTEHWRTYDDKPICFHCGRPGHVVRYCRERRQVFAEARTRNDGEGRNVGFSSRPPRYDADDDYVTPQTSTYFYRSSSPHPSRARSPARRQSQSPARRFSHKFRRELKTPLFKEPGPILKAANKNSIETIGKCVLNIEVNGLNISFEFVVMVECSHDIIFGWDFFKATEAFIDCGRNELHLGETSVLESREEENQRLFASDDFVIPPKSIKKISVINEEICGVRDVLVSTSKDLLLRKEVLIPNSLVTFRHGRGSIWVANGASWPQLIPSGMNMCTMESYENGNICSLIESSDKLQETQLKSREWSQKINLTLDPGLSEIQRLQLVSCLDEFIDIFDFGSTPIKPTSTVKHKINTGDHSPIKQRPYRVAPSERRLIQDEVNKMIENHIVKPSESPWSSPVILVRKKDGTWRFCVDYQPVLGHFDESADTHLHTDASGHGIEAVLLQIQGGKERPIAYASRSLTKAENNYSTTEKECLAVVWSISKFRPYLFGRPFTVVTDHHSLCWLVGQKDPSGRLARWALKLQEFDVTVIYKSGRKHKDADCLSRSPLENDQPSAVMSLTNVDIEQTKDPDLAKIIDNLNSGYTRKEFSIIDGILYKKNYSTTGRPWLMMIPKHLRSEVMADLHDAPTAGHLSFARTYDKVKKRFYWPGLYRTVRQYKRIKWRRRINVSMATTNSNFPRFREGEDLNCYLEQLEECFKLNKTLEADKVSVLLTSIDVNVYKTLRDLLVPRRPSDLKYKLLVEVLTNHLYPMKNKHFERYLFHKIVQKENEPVGKFVLRLKSQADKCKFTDINENLCDQFVSGCFDEATLKRLLSEPFLTFDSAIIIANSVEAAKSQVNLMKNPGHDIDNLKARSKNFKFPCKYNNPCKICGKSNHDTKLCKFKNAQCYICNKKGHIAPVCWNKKSAQNSGMNKPNQNKLNTIQCNTLENAPKIMVNVKIEDADTIMEVDTGADVSVVSKKFFLTNLKNVTLEKYSGHLKSFSGNMIPVFGKCLVNVSYKNYQEKLPLIVTGQFNNQTPLLGRNWIRILKADWPNCVFDICNNINVISNLELFLEVYKRVFEDKDLPIQGIKGSISLRPNAKPKFFKFRPVPFSIKEKIDKELDRLEKSQIIEKVNASDWSTPLVTVIKSNGELRLCGDFKNTLNNCIEDEKYPLPTIETMLGNLGGNKIFTKLDLSSAYHQIEMDEASKNLLVVSTHRGLYRYNRLPFGISPASAIFQRCMDSLFHDVPNTVIYLDDIFIGSKDEQEHYRILKIIFDKLKELNFTLNKEKCLFLKKDICFLGHIINEDGVRPDSKKLEALERCKKPFDKTSLKSFLGMLSFYSKYIPNMSTLAGPLYQLLKKDNRWKWSSQCEKAFLNLKLTLLNSQALIHYSMKLPLTLTCDASAYGISGVLCHIVEGEEKPITFVSRTLSSAEVKYSQTEKEALAIVFATSKLRQYLFGRKFVLKSDHKALTTVFGNKRLLPPLIANRLHRWALELSNFDFDIRYTNKDTMLCADAFSRLPLEEINLWEDNIDLVTHDISFLNVTPLDHLIIEEETNKDPVLNKLKEYLLEDPQLAKKDETMKPFLSKLENFSVLQGCIFVDSRAVIPSTCQDQMLKLLHQSHIGINRMKSLARSSVWWPKMDSQIEEFVKECSPCMHHQTAPPAENTPWPRTNQPWQRVHVDHFYFRGDCYLLVVDANSNWIEVFPVRGTTSQENIKLLRECFARYGLPQCLVFDNGPPFNSIEFKEFLRKNNVYHLTSPAYNPSSNGIAEVSVRIIKKSLEKSLEESPNSNMDCILQNVLFNYRNTPTSLDKPPVERLLSYVPRTFVNCLNSEFIQKTFGRNECGRRHFQVGDKVMFTRVIQKRRKWFKAQVIRRLGYNVYLVKNLKGTFKVHVNQMRTGSDTKYAEDSDWTLDNAGAGPHRLEQDPQISTTPPPRRSTRPRRPPCRFSPSMNNKRIRECQRRKKLPRRPAGQLVSIPPVEKPFYKVGVDLLGRFPVSKDGNRWIIVCTDYMTRYAITKAIPDGGAIETAKFLVDDVILKHGAPREMITYRGRNFISQVIKEINALCGIVHRFTTAYHPQTNGLTERFNKTLGDMLSMYTGVEQKDWDQVLPYVTFAYNTAKQEATGYTPFFLVHACEAEPYIDAVLPYLPDEISDDYVGELVIRAEEARQLSRSRLLQSQVKDRRLYDQKHTPVYYQKDDLVWVFTPIRKVGLSEKLLKRYFGPYKPRYTQLLRRLQRARRGQLHRLRRQHRADDPPGETICCDIRSRASAAMKEGIYWISWTRPSEDGFSFASGLSLAGRARDTNCLVLSSFMHHLHGYLPTDSSISMLQARLVRFVWGPDRTAWLPAGIISRPFSLSGFGLLDLGTQMRLACLKGVRTAMRGGLSTYSWHESGAWLIFLTGPGFQLDVDGCSESGRPLEGLGPEPQGAAAEPAFRPHHHRRLQLTPSTRSPRRLAVGGSVGWRHYRPWIRLTSGHARCPRGRSCAFAVTNRLMDENCRGAYRNDAAPVRRLRHAGSPSTGLRGLRHVLPECNPPPSPPLRGPGVP
ncbi:K02A2.6-like, partial [Cordylochernes scorpioides]